MPKVMLAEQAAGYFTVTKEYDAAKDKWVVKSQCIFCHLSIFIWYLFYPILSDPK